MSEQDIRKIILTYYKRPSMYHIISGDRRPKFENMVDMNKRHGIPYEAWIHLPSWLSSQEQKRREKQACENDIKKSDINRENVELA
jgi:hypothetical protein